MGESPGFWRAGGEAVSPPTAGVADTCATWRIQGKQRPPVDGEVKKSVGSAAGNPTRANFEPDHESTPLTVKGLGVLLGGEIEAGPSLEERAEDSIEELEGSGIDGEEGSEGGEEARVPKVRRAPKGPTQLDREQQEATHLPFRDWCAHCVRGAGNKTPHRRKC